MKLTLAAGILTGSLPVVSANAADTTLEGAQHFLLRNANGAIQASSLQKIKECNPNSEDPDVGVLSCGQGRFCMPKENSMLGGTCEYKEGVLNLVSKFRKRGTLKNTRKAFREPLGGSVECDPMADPDVGILSCDSSETCVPSTFSSMGGLCVSSIPGRRLQYGIMAPRGFCDPSSSYYMYYDCDCKGLDNATGTGEVTCIVYDNACLGNVYAGCSDVCVSQNITYTYANFSIPTYAACQEAITPYSQVVCFEESLVDGTCTVNLNDAPCTSCGVVPNGNYTAISFDCANVGGSQGVSYYGFDILPVVQSCSSLNSTTSTCDICNGPLVNPDAIATVLDFSFTCTQFTTLLNSTTCSLAAPVLAPTCCVASGNVTTPAPTSGVNEPTPAPSINSEPAPEPAPEPGPAPGGEGLAPSGGSTITFTKSTWLVSLGLAVAWTFGQTH